MNWFVQIQKCLPQKLITVLAGCLAENRWPPLKNFLIRQFIQSYQVNMSEAEALSICQYQNFNDFFTRSLRAGARPIAAGETDIICPADGAISEFGQIQSGIILQAKGKDYSVASLLADEQAENNFDRGSFATIYLSPKDYHRVHMPLSGKPSKITYIPGKLFSVNQQTANNLDKLFARNERLVIEFTNENSDGTESAPFVVVLVGAMIVGGMSTVLTGKIQRSKQIKVLDFEQKTLKKGDELGRFYLGSTAIMLFPEKLAVQFEETTKVGNSVKMGEKIGQYNE